MSHVKQNVCNFHLLRRYIYSHKIFVGLLFSCFGDALLNVDLFAFGMIMFAVAQVFYASAFGWKPLKLWIGLGLFIAGAIGMNSF